MTYFTKLYVRLSEQRGQAAAEYALIVGLVAVVTVGAWTLLGTQISSGINSLASQI